MKKFINEFKTMYLIDDHKIKSILESWTETIPRNSIPAQNVVYGFVLRQMFKNPIVKNGAIQMETGLTQEKAIALAREKISDKCGVKANKTNFHVWLNKKSNVRNIEEYRVEDSILPPDYDLPVSIDRIASIIMQDDFDIDSLIFEDDSE